MLPGPVFASATPMTDGAATAASVATKTNAARLIAKLTVLHVLLTLRIAPRCRNLADSIITTPNMCR